MVRKGGFEPPRSCERQPLKLVRLPFRHFRERGTVRLRPDTVHRALGKAAHGTLRDSTSTAEPASSEPLPELVPPASLPEPRSIPASSLQEFPPALSRPVSQALLVQAACLVRSPAAALPARHP